ncbi:hypothetical protein pb186bvf_007019 [Paramecium bursaria]
MYIPYKKNKGYKVPLIFEFGSLNLKVGYAGMVQPDIVKPSDYLIDQDGQMKFLEFNSTSQQVGYEIKAANDLDSIQMHMDHCLTTLRQEKGFPCFIIEDRPLNRNKFIEILFDEIEVSSVFFHKSALLAQYLIGRETILVVDCGANQTTVTPIVDGSIIEKGVVRGDVGGEYINSKLYDLWKPQNLQFSRYQNYAELHPSVQRWGDMEVIREARHQMFKFFDQPIQNLKFNPAVDNQVFELPDQTKLEISVESYTYPEIIFEQSENFEGLDRAIELSLEKIDPDYRKELIQNIIMIGGVSLTTNMIERMQRTLKSNRAKIQNFPKNFDLQYASWIGASIISSSAVFEQWTITKADYEEHGAALIEKKMFY